MWKEEISNAVSLKLKGLRTSSFCKQQTRSRDPQWACTVRILRHLFTVKQLAKSLYLAYSAIGRNLRLFRVVSTYFLLSTVIQFKHTSSAYIHTFFEMALALLFCVNRSVPRARFRAYCLLDSELRREGQN